MTPVKKRFVFAVLMAVLSFTLFTGCDSPMGGFVLPPDSNANNTINNPEIIPPDIEIPPGYGAVKITVTGPRSAARTILPVVPVKTYYCWLEFIDTSDNLVKNSGWMTIPDYKVDDDDIFLLPADKDYVLRVTACHIDDTDTSIAEKTSTTFHVYEGVLIDIDNIYLELYDPLPATDGTGTFSYDMSLLDTDEWLVALETAYMEISGMDNSIYEVRSFRNSSGYQDKKIDSLQLPPGHYRMRLNFGSARGRSAYIREIVHIYRNLESVYTLTNLNYKYFTTFTNGDVIVAAANPLAPEQMLVISVIDKTGSPYYGTYAPHNDYGSKIVCLYDGGDSITVKADILLGDADGAPEDLEWYIDTDADPLRYGNDVIIIKYDGIYIEGELLPIYPFDDPDGGQLSYEITALTKYNSAAFRIEIERN